MPTTMIAQMTEQLYQTYRARYPKLTATLEARYTVEAPKPGADPAAYWLKCEQAYVEPFGTREAAEEGLKATIMGLLQQQALTDRAAGA